MEQINIGTTVVSVQHISGRQFRWSIDFDDGAECSGDGLYCGAMRADEHEMLGTLLAFLEVAADAYGYTLRTGRVDRRSDMFEYSVMEWAYDNSDELSMVRYALEMEEV